MKKSKSVDEYISCFPKETQRLLKQVRTTIQQAAPQAEEVISYGMPGYKLNGMLVWFAGFTNHIGFYPRGASAIKAFKKELAGYKTSKGAVQFPKDKPMPIALLKKMVKYRWQKIWERGRNNSFHVTQMLHTYHAFASQSFYASIAKKPCHSLTYWLYVISIKIHYSNSV